MRKNEWKREPTKQARPPESRTIGARDAKMSTLAKIIRKSQAMMNRSSARKRTEYRDIHVHVYATKFPWIQRFSTQTDPTCINSWVLAILATWKLLVKTPILLLVLFLCVQCCVIVNVFRDVRFTHARCYPLTDHPGKIFTRQIIFDVLCKHRAWWIPWLPETKVVSVVY